MEVKLCPFMREIQQREGGERRARAEANRAEHRTAQAERDMEAAARRKVEREEKLKAVEAQGYRGVVGSSARRGASSEAAQLGLAGLAAPVSAGGGPLPTRPGDSELERRVAATLTSGSWIHLDQIVDRCGQGVLLRAKQTVSDFVTDKKGKLTLVAAALLLGMMLLPMP